MGQDSWNLQYGKMHPAKYRKGTAVDMHSDEGYGGEKMIPGYAGAYKNSKTRVLKANGTPKTYGSEGAKKGIKYARATGEISMQRSKRRR